MRRIEIPKLACGNTIERNAARCTTPQILILTEGQTEERYFSELRKRFRLQGVTVINPQCTEALPLVETAEEYLLRGRRANNKLSHDAQKTFAKHHFRYIFIVFDQDEKTDLVRQAIRRIDELTAQAIKCDQGGTAQFFAILSVPCFEVWTLLHKKSLGSRQMTSKEILRELEKVIPDYKKNKSGMFDRLYTELGGAIQRAETLLAISSAPADTKTYVHDLVRFLLSQVR